jgi:HK97 family phage portal protein
MGKKSRQKAIIPADNQQVFADGPSYSISDPAFAEFLRMSGINLETMDEPRAMGLTAYYRACALISGTIAGLPFRVYERNDDGSRTEVEHFLSRNPAGPYDLSAFSWVEMVMLHLLNHAETYLKSIHNEGGELIGLWPIHPLACNKVEWEGAEKVFTFALKGGSTDILRSGEITQVLGMTNDGLRGMSPLTLLRRSLQTSAAGELAANRSFSGGHLISGIVTTEEDVEETEAKTIKADLNAKMRGPEHAGDIAFVNRALKFQPWTMSNEDAQFVESRGLQIEETARIFGLPISLLSVGGAVSNWGTGVAESFLGLQKFVLTAWTSRIESAVLRILPPNHFAEFDYKGLFQGSPKDEIELLIQQVNAGLLTKDEARAVMNRPPLPPEAAAPPAPPEEAS